MVYATHSLTKLKFFVDNFDMDPLSYPFTLNYASSSVEHPDVIEYLINKGCDPDSGHYNREEVRHPFFLII